MRLITMETRGGPIINAPPDTLLKFHGSLFLSRWGQPNSLVMPSLKFHVLIWRHWDNRAPPRLDSPQLVRTRDLEWECVCGRQGLPSFESVRTFVCSAIQVAYNPTADSVSYGLMVPDLWNRICFLLIMSLAVDK